MLKNKLLIAGIFLIQFMTFSQQSTIGHLTIFSEDGDKFLMVLNGQIQNNIPQTNIRVEGLKQPYYTVTLKFEDKNLSELTKNNLMIKDVDGNMSDVTYKIKRDKNNPGKMKLNFYSSIPVQDDYVAPENVYVIHYGQPINASNTQSGSQQVEGDQGTITQTTTTTTTTNGGQNNVNANMNIGGVNMGITINDNMGDDISSSSSTTTTTTTRTTTTTSSSNSSANSSNYSNQGYEVEQTDNSGCTNRYAMNSKDFNAAMATLQKQSFEDTRLKTAKQIVAANCLSVDQIIQIANTFSFEDNKLDFAKFAYDYCTEPKNYFKLNGIFSFSSNADELSDYIQNRN